MHTSILRSMQSLSQEVWRRKPALVNSDASIGELAWSWGSEVETRGVVYEHEPASPWHLLNARGLDDIEEPIFLDGYALKTMRDIADVPRRVAVHQAAWNSKRVNDESYTRLMQTWPYRDDLDFVVEAPNGTLVASEISWYDEENRVGEFEPVGTHPNYRQRGIGRALMLFGLQCFRDAGAEQAIVGCRGDDDYPIPKRLYESAGFREISRDVPMVKRQ